MYDRRVPKSCGYPANLDARGKSPVLNGAHNIEHPLTLVHQEEEKFSRSDARHIVRFKMYCIRKRDNFAIPRPLRKNVIMPFSPASEFRSNPI